MKASIQQAGYILYIERDSVKDIYGTDLTFITRFDETHPYTHIYVVVFGPFGWKYSPKKILLFEETKNSLQIWYETPVSQTGYITDLVRGSCMADRLYDRLGTRLLYGRPAIRQTWYEAAVWQTGYTTDLVRGSCMADRL